MKILKEIPYYRLCGIKEWRMVKGHPRYAVSCDGQVLCWNWGRTEKPNICKLSKTKTGYLQVGIDGVYKLVHNIVADIFIPNQEEKPCIDHINTIRTDNRVENLRWCTYKENCNNPLTLKHHGIRGKFGEEHHCSIGIVQLTLDEKFIRKWSCAREVERELGIASTHISACCRGRRKSAGGFKWVYLSDWISKY